MAMATKLKLQNAKMRDTFVEGLLAENRDLKAEIVRLRPFEKRCAEQAWETARGYENEKMDIRQMEADMKTPYRSKKQFDGDGLNPDLPVHPQVWKVSIHGEEGVRACVEKRH